MICTFFYCRLFFFRYTARQQSDLESVTPMTGIFVDPRGTAYLLCSLMPMGTNICSFNDGRRCTFKIQKCNTGQIHYSRRIRPLLPLHIYDGIYCGARSLACLGQFITIWYWPEEVVANEKVVWLQTPPLEGFEYSTLLVDYATFSVINKSM